MTGRRTRRYFTEEKKNAIREDGVFPMVRRLGFEPRTISLKGCCSTKLSYRRAADFEQSNNSKDAQK